MSVPWANGRAHNLACATFIAPGLFAGFTWWFAALGMSPSAILARVAVSFRGAITEIEHA